MSLKAETLKEIFRNFAQEKYLTKETKEFYVNLYNRDLRRFVTALRDNQIPSHSFFIAGQSGNGKSSVLNLLTTNYPQLEDVYIFNYIAGREVFLYEDIDIVDILLMIGYKLTQNSPTLREKYFEKLQKLKDIKTGVLVESNYTSSKETDGINTKGYIGLGAKFFNIFKMGGDFEATYKINEEVRKDARKFFKLNKNSLIELINSIILDYKIELNTNKELLIVLDDLEKKEDIDELFTKELYLLDELKLIKIITMPLHLQRTQTFATKDIREFGLKLFDYDGNVYQSDRELLREVIDKRIANKNLITEEAIDKAIEFSGGNLRQLIKLVHFSAEEALSFDEEFISIKEMQYSIEKLEREYSSKVMIMKGFLNTIREYKGITSETKEDLEYLSKATKMELIFAYFNGIIWYDINPVIAKSLSIYSKMRQ